ncbi:hypothetical protein GN244_ATG16971 [Phytophthora infestans]|uniref:Uncharacterized protein n=1 Tax=Phytophthora infestans TaxID=4787 RepID=A0A833W5W7_PHYIN|nr:hypothetical protein GN244_ATG16971 [Phytophthora infestans]KAF4127696.1 hypothetical protein GN958_ATG23122 [Phytophthora infestans]KAF4130376.1 hypothetical protein GN958_ATG20433 [Phytophthora infestans]KAF4133464.1 hypothetical protein GN958_ATG17345 [Phytophthora infestans]
MVVAATETVGGPVTSGVEPAKTAPAHAESASDAAEDAGVGATAQRIHTDVSDFATVHTAGVDGSCLRVSELQLVCLIAC